MTRLEEMMIESCELTLEEVQKLRDFLNIVEAKKKETRALYAMECRKVAQSRKSEART